MSDTARAFFAGTWLGVMGTLALVYLVVGLR
jgi:hypothetical protein